jgi:hypothetical protein
MPREVTSIPRSKCFSAQDPPSGGSIGTGPTGAGRTEPGLGTRDDWRGLVSTNPTTESVAVRRQAPYSQQARAQCARLSGRAGSPPDTRVEDGSATERVGCSIGAEHGQIRLGLLRGGRWRVNGARGGTTRAAWVFFVLGGKCLDGDRTGRGRCRTDAARMRRRDNEVAAEASGGRPTCGRPGRPNWGCCYRHKQSQCGREANDLAICF